MSGRKRDNGEGSIYPYPHGYRAYAWVTTPDGHRRRKYVTGTTRQEVHDKWLALQQAAKRGPVATSSPKLSDFLHRWLVTEVGPSLAPATTEAYARCVRLYINPGLGTKRLDRLMVGDVRDWINALRVTCQCCAQGKDAVRETPRCCAKGRCCHEVLADWTVHQAWRVLSAGLSSAMREELVQRNVAMLIRMPMPRRERAKIWTVEEARTFLRSAEADDDPMYVAYVLLLVLGLRRGEMLGLGWDDVDLDARTVSIRWQLQRRDSGMVRTRTKTISSEAVLPLPEVCVSALRQQRERQRAASVSAGDAWHSMGLVVTSRYGTPLEPRNFLRYFNVRARLAGVPVIPVHSTRRTCASLLVAMNVHPRVAMQILRHSQISVTMDIYAQVAPAAAREALDRLGESVFGELDFHHTAPRSVAGATLD